MGKNKEHEVPMKTFADFKKELPSIDRILVYGTAAIMLVAFATLFVYNPTTTGLSVVESSAADNTSRFQGSASLLMVIFAVFGLCIFLMAKRLNEGNNRM